MHKDSFFDLFMMIYSILFWKISI